MDENLLLQLKRNDPSIPWVVLSWSTVGADGARALARALVRNSTVTNLVLARCAIGDRGVKYLASVLRRNRTITHLNLQCNGIGDAGALDLAGALRRNETLTHLFLSNNTIGPAGVGAIANAIFRPGSAVEHLTLSSNCFGADGAEAVSRALSAGGGGGRAIDCIDLSTNRIGDEGAISLAHALSSPRGSVRVRSLDLSWNDIGGRGFRTLAEALCHNPGSVPHLTLDGNRFNDEDSEIAAGAFAALVQSDASRIRIHLRDIADARDLCLGSTVVGARQDDKIRMIHTLAGLSVWGLKRRDLRTLLKAIVRESMFRVAEESQEVDDCVVPELLDHLGETIGLSGIFSFVNTRPELFRGGKIELLS